MRSTPLRLSRGAFGIGRFSQAMQLLVIATRSQPSSPAETELQGFAVAKF
jgi:hypothetical protein